MLALMKSLMNSFIGKVVIMIMIAGMAFWGMDQMFTQIRSGLGANLAGAGNRSLDPVSFDRRVEVVLQNINSDSETPVTKSDALEDGLIDQIYQRQVAELVYLGFASSIGVDPSADAVIRELNDVDAFKNPLTGELDLNTYQQVLRSNGFSQVEYEAQLSDQLTMDALNEGARMAVVAPSILTNINLNYLAEQRDIAWFVFDATDAPEPAAPTDEEVRAFYDENLQTLREPERRMIDLLRMSADDFLHEITVTEQEIATIYEAMKSERFSEPDTRTYVEMRFASRDEARAAFGMLAGGADTASLSGIVSSETKTGRAESVVDEALREAMFGRGRQSGALFGPRQVGDQWMVARLISVQPGAVFPIETVADQIRDELARERADLLLYEKMELLDRAIGAGYDLPQIAKEVGLPLITTVPVDRNGYSKDGIPMVTLMSAGDAFAQAFEIGEGQTSNRYDAADAIYLTSPRKLIESYTPPFEELEADVREALHLQRKSNAVQTVVDDTVERIQSGQSDLDDEANLRDAIVETLPLPLTRANAEASGFPTSTFNAIFSAEEGDVFAFPSRTGEQVMIVQVREISAPAEADMTQLQTSTSTSVVNSLKTRSDLLCRDGDRHLNETTSK